MKSSVVERLLDCGVVGVVRLGPGYDLLGLARALSAGGVEAVEITMTTPGALEAISQVSRELGDSFLIGAGTVLDGSGADAALDAGAKFVVGPNLEEEVVAATQARDGVVISGALTPTEIGRALRLGVDIIKVFPGRVGTPGYFKDLLGPFPDARLMPTGNVDLTTAPQYFAAGAVAVGVGKALIDPEAALAGNWDVIASRAKRFRAIVEESRGNAVVGTPAAH